MTGDRQMPKETALEEAERLAREPDATPEIKAYATWLRWLARPGNEAPEESNN